MSELNEVEARLQTHEAVCAERYLGIFARLKRIEQAVYWAATAMIGALAYIAWGVAASK
jgi:hypothetical protein